MPKKTLINLEDIVHYLFDIVKVSSPSNYRFTTYVMDS